MGHDEPSFCKNFNPFLKQRKAQINWINSNIWKFVNLSEFQNQSNSYYCKEQDSIENWSLPTLTRKSSKQEIYPCKNVKPAEMACVCTGYRRTLAQQNFNFSARKESLDNSLAAISLITNGISVCRSCLPWGNLCSLFIEIKCNSHAWLQKLTGNMFSPFKPNLW